MAGKRKIRQRLAGKGCFAPLRSPDVIHQHQLPKSTTSPHQLPKINYFSPDQGTEVSKLCTDALERQMDIKEPTWAVPEGVQILVCFNETRLLIFSGNRCPARAAVMGLLNYLVSHSRDGRCSCQVPSPATVSCHWGHKISGIRRRVCFTDLLVYLTTHSILPCAQLEMCPLQSSSRGEKTEKTRNNCLQ